MLQHKKILLGITGSIAAYKSAFLIRELVKKGAEVKVVASTSALEFITPLTLSTLSKNPIYSKFVKNEQGEWTNHVELALWADVFLVAPISANTLAKFANGICDNLLSATYLSAKCPVLVAPAMDLDMYKHPSVQKNIQTLKDFGNQIIDVEEGELASGLVGKGRMAEPENIVKILESFFSKKKRFESKNILITAGPTKEHIDPVRYISNHSTGKMGFALAEELAQEGAKVTVVSGPVSVTKQHKNITVKNVSSAVEMLEESEKLYSNTDISIFAAAVSDYRPKHIEEHKIKKNAHEVAIELVKNPDIALELGKLKSSNQLNIGFALETENEIENAQKKLEKKNLDFVVLNSLQDKGAGFKHNTNKISIIERNNIRKFELKSKVEVAKDIINAIAEKANI